MLKRDSFLDSRFSGKVIIEAGFSERHYLHMKNPQDFFSAFKRRVGLVRSSSFKQFKFLFSNAKRSLRENKHLSAE